MSQDMPDGSRHDELSEIVARLQAERPEAAPAELDRIKQRALARAAETGSRSRGRQRWMRRGVSSWAAAALAGVALIAGGTVFAKSGGFKDASSGGSAASSQYCPPGSQTGGKKQDPRPENCGVALTIGYWRNHQKHLELLLPVTLGSFAVTDFSTAKAVFDAANCSSKTIRKTSQGTVGCLAGQLLASTLNVKNNASTCIQPTIDAANALLQSIGYVGPSGTYTLTDAQRAQAIQLKDALDKYNNTGNC
jgi:hypothetical protein